MKRLVMVSVVMAAFGVLGARSDAAPEAGWHSDFEQAQKLARQLNRPLLVHFSAEWCGPCRRMERGVLNSAEVLSHIASATVGVKVDSDKRRDLVQKFNVRSLPTDLIVDPNGRVLAKSEGYQAQRQYLAQLARVEARWQRDNKTQIVRTEKPTPTIPADSRLVRNEVESSDDPGSLSAPDTVPVAQPKIVIGLDRYSPVSLYNSRSWLRGRSEFSVEHKGVTYYLASPTEQAEFRDNPGKFAPQLLGCDPVVLWQTDRAVPGSTEFGAYFDGELFLFASLETRKQFKKNPFRYTRTRQVLKLDQIQRTRLQ